MKRSAAHVVLHVGVGAGLQEAFGGIRSGVPSSQVERSLARTVSLVVEVGALVNEVRDDFCRGIFFLFTVAGLKSSAAAGSDHQGSETI